MSELIELDDAARILGISADELVEHRSRGDINGLRSGSTWKFKRGEVDRFKRELESRVDDEFSISLDDDDDVDREFNLDDIASDVGLDQPTGEPRARDAGHDLTDGPLSLDLDDDESAESVLVSEIELGRSDDSTSSTIIGQVESDADDNDLKFSAPEESGGGVDRGSTASKESDVQLVSNSDVLDDSLAKDVDSDLRLVGSGDKMNEQATRDSEIDLDESPVGGAGGASSLHLAGDGASDGDISLESDLDLHGSSLHLEDDRDLHVGGKSDASGLRLKGEIDPGDDVADSNHSIDLDDDEMVLDIGGSDVTLDASESGINLGQPSDSGLSLEDAMLELEADGGPEMMSLEDDSDSSSDDEFLLTPVEDVATLDDDGSGSQVIELEDDLSGSEVSEAVELLEDDGALELDDDAGLSDVAPVAVAPSTAPLVATGGDAGESEYTLNNILMLFTLVGIMALGSLMVSDIMRSMWAWSEPFSVTSSLMELFTSILP